MIIFDAMQQDKSNTLFISINWGITLFCFNMVCLIELFRLLNGRIKARRKQLNQIASLLEMTSCETNYAPCNNTLKQSWYMFLIIFKYFYWLSTTFI